MNNRKNNNAGMLYVILLIIILLVLYLIYNKIKKNIEGFYNKSKKEDYYKIDCNKITQKQLDDFAALSLSKYVIDKSTNIRVYKQLNFTMIYDKTSSNKATRVPSCLLSAERKGYNESFVYSLNRYYKNNNINEFLKLLLAYAKNGGLLINITAVQRSGYTSEQGAFELMLYIPSLMLMFIDIIKKNKVIENTRSADIKTITKWMNKVVDKCANYFGNRQNNKIYFYGTVKLLNYFLKYKYDCNNNCSDLISNINNINTLITNRIKTDIRNDGYMKPELRRCSRAYSYHIYTLNGLKFYLAVLKGIKTYPFFSRVKFDYSGTKTKLYNSIEKIMYTNNNEKEIIIKNIETAAQNLANTEMEKIRIKFKNIENKYDKDPLYNEYKECCTAIGHKCNNFITQTNYTKPLNYNEIYDYLYNKTTNNNVDSLKVKDIEKIFSINDIVSIISN